MPLRVMQFLAIVFPALALVPAGAHLFELPAKISLTREDYFIVQAIYSGWALFGFVLVSAITANLVLTVMLQGRGVHRSEEHTSELQSLMRTSYAVFCLKKKNKDKIKYRSNS